MSASCMVDSFCKDIDTPKQCIQDVAHEMVQEMYVGLERNSEGKSKLGMLLTYVNTLPDGQEEGLFYALDLGGTNIRVLRVQLGGKSILNFESTHVPVPFAVMTGGNDELFDFIVSKIADFVSTEGDGFQLLEDQERVIGFTFSFPVEQKAIDSGVLMKWTKGFAIPETIGRDIVEELQAAMARKGLNIKVVALLNDTVGTLAGGRFNDKNMMAGIIFGTGTNACYVETVKSIPKWEGPHPESGYTIINTEWGSFSSPCLPKTEIDDDLDSESVNPGQQTFEKMVSGMYLGEIVRRVLCTLTIEASLFGDKTYPNLFVPFILNTFHVCAIHSDASPDLQEATRVLRNVFRVDESTLETRKLILRVCDAITKRAARLSGAAIVALLLKMKRPADKSTVIAMDGSLYEHYTAFRNYLNESVMELYGKEACKFLKIQLTKDGSGIGACLLAARAQTSGRGSFSRG